MQAYLGGHSVTLTIPLIDADGATIAAQTASYRVIDQEEAELVAKVAHPTFIEGDESIEILIDGAINTLPLGETRGMRVVELFLETAIGTIKLEQGYFIEATEVLVEGVNTFATYNKALYLSYEIPNIPGWTDAPRQGRIAALIAARRNIGRLRFRYAFGANQDIIDNTVGVSDLTNATLDQWNALPKDFKEALYRAQIIEADFLLGGDEIGDLRRSGLMSMSVGEAKQFFRTTRPLEGVVCKRAMKELSKWAVTGLRLARG